MIETLTLRLPVFEYVDNCQTFNQRLRKYLGSGVGGDAGED